MKLGELKSAIRGMKGNPAIPMQLTDGRKVWVKVMKQSVLDGLDQSFEHKGIETNLMLDGELIVQEGVLPLVSKSLSLDDLEPAPASRFVLDI